ncbi:succinate dehydrogenase cytochrome b subunit [Chryseosolibacter indicus]|uniref:Succinate dehydrogenase cytochrome b subunit n=1 Tax=Chryseosolibacter indicus TaxID=2782351 RepID=A0ABS5VMY8_9BACT|nr:succinate dehydrogenase cytochrome b subunit [Chryseosolibacter indicus]MBT1702383.1 succinate dehydrogenase cytochrome b subunit [Chryseosolibacter indicus]
MNWFTNFFSSSIGRKLVMALTGLFLILFLVVHLAGNLQLLLNDGGKAFNIYAHTMTSNIFIKIVGYVNYTMILLHVIWAIWLTRTNKTSRPVGYAVSKNSSTWSSRNMGILGTLILLFLVFHLQGFWYRMHWGPIDTVSYDGEEYRNLYAVVDFAYSHLWYTAIYVISMAILAFHLYHGFGSAFQTLGLNHVKYNPVIKFIGVAFAIIVPALFALIPIVMFLN